MVVSPGKALTFKGLAPPCLTSAGRRTQALHGQGSARA